jgi:hypothetical protein
MTSYGQAGLLVGALPLVENALTTARANDANRYRTESDGLDLQHAAVALAYCDIFYSRDAYQPQCAMVGRKALTSHSLLYVCLARSDRGRRVC